eukprot:TRINITY_DN623_c0_g1_i1.p1 TRINITY_DN623_c0_g1~~TRINITY_DN623_c0_g1_i1.p1  ORF type:complete len:227 (+),score=58.68 TRINITY_DN623_c0_g1_i1:223-903(+)
MENSAQDPANSWGLTLKEGERIVAPTRRPDGTLRKAIKIRAGYVPQEEVAIYQSKAALMRRNVPTVPPGYDPELDSNTKPKTKSAKRNERRKEKRQQQQQQQQQVTADSSISEKFNPSENNSNGRNIATQGLNEVNHGVEDVAQQMNSLSVSANTSDIHNNEQASSGKLDVDKRIRALKKKIRLAEVQQISLNGKEQLNSDQKEKLAKLDIWRAELKELEKKKSDH